MTTADKVFKTLLSNIRSETGVEPTDIKLIYDEVTTLRFTAEQPLGLLTRLVGRPINGHFEPEAGDQALEDGVSVAQASKATQQQALQAAYDTLLKTVQSGQLPARRESAYQRFSARFWRLDPCRTCAGVGGGPCRSCSGEQTFTCTQCDGKAKVDCSCNYGRVQCTQCYGAGSRIERGWEYKTVEIPQYNAPSRFESYNVPIEKRVLCGCDAGWVSCNTCHGSGELACPASACLGGRCICGTCRGSGEAPPCQPCTGSGQTGTLHEGAVHLDWGQTQVTLPPKMSDVESLVRLSLGSDNRLLGESTVTFKTVTPRDTTESPHALVVTQDARLKIVRVDVDFSGKTYQVIGYGDQPRLAADGGLQSRLAAPIRKERAEAHEKAQLADTINRQALMNAIKTLTQVRDKRSASSREMRAALKNSMSSVYFKEEVNRLLSDPIKREHFWSGQIVSNRDDHHLFRTGVMDNVERIYVNLKRNYTNTVLLCMALVMGLGTGLGSPLAAGVICLFMTPIGLHDRFFRTLLFKQFQDIFDSPEKRLASFKSILCSRSVITPSEAEEYVDVLAEPGLSIRIRGVFLIVSMGLVVLIARHGAAGALDQLKGWAEAALRWFA